MRPLLYFVRLSFWAASYFCAGIDCCLQSFSRCLLLVNSFWRREKICVLSRLNSIFISLLDWSRSFALSFFPSNFRQLRSLAPLFYISIFPISPPPYPPDYVRFFILGAPLLPSYAKTGLLFGPPHTEESWEEEPLVQLNLFCFFFRFPRIWFFFYTLIYSNPSFFKESLKDSFSLVCHPPKWNKVDVVIWFFLFYPITPVTTYLITLCLYLTPFLNS